MLRLSAIPLLLALSTLPGTAGPAARTIVLHGRPQTLRLYGPSTSARVVVLASGDGGWMHLAPHVAELFAAHGWFVIGLDSKAYLSGNDRNPLQTRDIVSDYRAILQSVDPSRSAPLLVGISEGAGFSVVAASDPDIQQRIGGVMVLGLANNNELAWHWRDAVIYVTKGVPDEPLFHAEDFLPHVSPIPLAWLRSAHDEYIPARESDHGFALARQPARQWTINAGDHRFSDNLQELDRRLLEALDWIAVSAGPPRSQ